MPFRPPGPAQKHVSVSTPPSLPALPFLLNPEADHQGDTLTSSDRRRQHLKLKLNLRLKLKVKQSNQQTQSGLKAPNDRSYHNHNLSPKAWSWRMIMRKVSRLYGSW
jgi:hypothetical protein